MTFYKIIEILEAEIIINSDDVDTEIHYVCSTDLMSDLLHFSSTPRALLITGLANTQVVRTAEIADIKAVVFVLGKRPDKETLEMARQKRITLIVTRLSRFTACGRLYAAGLKSCTGDHR
ncbi:MAG TPA: DRTGG domain-containing protein [Thermodesulfovibrionales bacterium]|nr:DRTGG domain-containing protein [Thermodesulfovibrionales bacterium]